jgi:hypothetical protein
MNARPDGTVPTLRDLVREALGNALENGYDDFLRTNTSRVIVTDLMTYDAELERVEVGRIPEMVRLVTEWKEERGW